MVFHMLAVFDRGEAAPACRVLRLHDTRILPRLLICK
jgi:hypothetical protein